MNKKTTISCYLIGEGNLSIQCLELLQENGHRICGILSSDKALYEWAINHDIKHWETLEDWLSIVDDKSVDYIFSVVNPILLPKEALRKARHFAINYHDSLLPRHAGVHATAWAILNQETEHGITWHIVDSCIDTGDILKQVQIPIANDETTLSLNLNCQQAAIESFKVLIDELVTSTYARVPQDLSQRSYNASRKKPPGNGVINWNQPAKDIERLYRALSFGNHPNRLASLKLIVGTQCYLVTKLSILEDTSSSIPGQIINVCEEQIRVTAVGGDIIVTGLSTVTGEDVSVKKIISETNLKVGEKLKNISTSLQKQLVKVSEDIFKNEGYWVKQLRKGNAMPFPYLEHTYFDTQKCIVEETFEIPEIKKLSKKNIKIDIYFMTVWLIYLYRLNNYQPVHIGFKHAGVQHSISDNLKFLFTESVPLLAEFDPTISFAQAYEYTQSLINKIISQKTFLKDAFARYPTLKEVREPIHYPCQLTLDIQDFKVSHKITNTLNVDSKRGVYQICIHVNAKQKDWARLLLQRIHKHLITITKSSFSNPDATLVELELLTQQERCQILALSSTYDADEPYLHKTIPELFEEQVKRKPHATAILYQDNKITYATLNEYANLVANYLLQQGVKPKSPIAIYSYRCPEAIIAMLAILKIGAFYVPIDPDYPLERVSFIINDANIYLGLTNNTCKKQGEEVFVANPKVQWINLTKLMTETKKPDIKFNVKNSSEEIAYLLYTSGTTGKPKGVLVPQRGINRLVKGPGKILIRREDCVLQLSNLVFDASTFEIWGPLLNGAILKILDKETGNNLHHLAQALRKNSTFVFMTPTIFKEIMDVDPEAFDYLRVLVLGGEAVHPAIIKSFLKRVKNQKLHITLINGYGPTENSVFSTTYTVKKELSANSIIPIGQPISHTQAYILDKYHQLLPIGISGELCVGGVGLANGYLNRPNLNERVFIKNLFSFQQSTKLYRTGDRVRWLHDGNLEFIGREDNQIKIRGMRVELGEIEHHILKNSEIKQTTVLVQNNQAKQKTLVAYVVPNDGASISVEYLSQRLKEHLPLHMVPYHIVFLKNIPVTINGKIDKEKLSTQIIRSSTKYQSPQGNIEKRLAQIWKNVFNIRKVSRLDDYYRLGGDSITAMQISAQARQVGLAVKVSDILTYTTLSKLSPFIKPLQNNLNQKHEIYNGEINLTPIQQWFFDQHLQSPNEFSQYVLLHVTKSLELKIMQKALRQILSYHEMLRVGFRQGKQGWNQFLPEQCENIQIESLSINKIPRKEFLAFVENYARKVQKRFKLDCPPLMKVASINTTDNQQYMLIVIHHLIVDGVSWRILLTDLWNFYQENLKGKQETLPIKTSSYQAWSTYLQQYACSKSIQDQRQYWLQEYSNKFNLPGNEKKLTNTQKSSQTVTVQLSLAYSHQLLCQIPQGKSLSITDLLISALVQTLGKWSNQSEIYLHLEGHGRENLAEAIDVTRTIGWFTTIYPTVFKLTNDTSNLTDLIKVIKAKLRSIHVNGIGYGVLRYLSKDRYLMQQLRNHERQVISFNYLGQFTETLFNDEKAVRFYGPPIQLINGDDNYRPFLLEITGWMDQGKLTFAWNYHSQIYEHKSITVIANQYLKCVIDLINHLKSSKYAFLVPAEFPLVSMNQGQLDQLINHYPNLEDIWPLSGAQQGLLFHHLYQPSQDMYLVQFSWQDTRGIQLDQFKCAWEILLARHPALRACYNWQQLKVPVQIINKGVDLPWHVHNLSELTQTEQQIHLNNFLQADRQKLFDLSKFPLMRVNIFKLTKNEYVIFWTHHHILLGGWSLQLIFKELYELYQQLLDLQNPITTVPHSYGDYLQWLVNHNTSNDKTFWVDYLKDCRYIQPFPIASKPYKSLHKPGDRFERFETGLSSSLVNKLQRFICQQQCSLNTVMQFAWCFLISRYTQSDDITIGITVSTRTPSFKGIDQAVGLFINTLPFRIRLQGKDTVVKHLKRVQTLMTEINKHHHTSLIDIHNWLSLNYQDELFHTLFIFENYPLLHQDPAIKNVQIEDMTHYPITMEVYPQKNCIKLTVAYQETQFHEMFIKQLLNHYLYVLSNIIDKADKPLAKINLLSIVEQQKALALGCGSQIDYPQKSLAQIFLETAHKYPDKGAVIHGDKTLTYAALNQQANQLAHYLKQQGVIANTPVAIYFNRGIEMVIAILAILKGGGAYVPIDTQYPESRILDILQHAEVNFLLSAKSNYQDLKQIFRRWKLPLSLININECQHYQNQSTGNFNQASNTKNLAYIIYTSGTTGKPKGVMVTQKAVVNVVNSVFNTINASSEDVLLSVTSIGFDISVLEIIGALLWGMRLVIAPEEAVSDGKQIKRLMTKEKITLMQATPATWYLLLECGWTSGTSIKALCGGEKLTPQLATRLLANGVKLWNMYGPTETTIWSTLTRVVKGQSHIMIGKPISNTSIVLLDKQRRLVPFGCIGELNIGGMGLALGYLNDPNLTAERFINYMFHDGSTQRLYQTGDLGRWLPSGELEYIDRLDNQVKIRGYRIELNAIENLLAKHPDIKQCVVMKIGNDYADQKLVAYYIPVSLEKILAPRDLQDFLIKSLPNYMVPQVYLPLQQIPLTLSGKINRKQLGQLPFDGNHLIQKKPLIFVTPTEHLIADIFAKVLGHKSVNLQDSFFNLGGNSIKSVRLLLMLQKKFSVNLKIRQLFQNDTPLSLANLISQPSITDDSAIISPIICLQSQGNNTPLFMVHPIGGTIFWLASIARYLGCQRPLYALQDPGLETGKIVFGSFTEMAKFYTKSIMEVCDQGPYLLAGASFGANMAVEIARQLQQRGKIVKFIGLLDGWAFYPKTVKTRTFLEDHLKRQTLEIQDKLKMLDFNVVYKQPCIDLHWHRADLLANHQLKSIDADLILFKSEQTSSVLKPIEALDNHWAEYCRNLDVISVPGDHETMFYDPNVQVLAKKLHRVISDVEYRSSIITESNVASSEI